jgi:hypothetical protein
MRHLLEHGLYQRDNVLPVNDNPLLRWHPQGDVQHGSPFGDIDPFTGEHGLGSLSQAGSLGESHKQLKGVLRQSVFRVVQVQIACLDRHGGAP